MSMPTHEEMREDSEREFREELLEVLRGIRDDGRKALDRVLNPSTCGYCDHDRKRGEGYRRCEVACRYLLAAHEKGSTEEALRDLWEARTHAKKGLELLNS